MQSLMSCTNYYPVSALGTTNSAPIFWRSHSSLRVLILRGFRLLRLGFSLFSFYTPKNTQIDPIKKHYGNCLRPWDYYMFLVSPYVFVFLSLCLWCLAASALSTGQRNRMGQCRILVLPFHHPCDKKKRVNLDKQLKLLPTNTSMIWLAIIILSLHDIFVST